MPSVERIIDIMFLLIYLSTISGSVAKKRYFLDRSAVSVLYYALHYTPNFEKRTFTSNMTLGIKVHSIRKAIQYYQVNMSSKNEVLINPEPEDSKDWNKRHDVVKRSDSESTNILELSYIEKNPIFTAGHYRVRFPESSGSLENNLEGLYIDGYPDEDYQNIPKGNLVEDEFESTKLLSPSSVAFTISKMKILPNKVCDFHRIVARPEVFKSESHKNVLTLINTAYTLIEKFLNVTCELDNLYHVTLPSNKMKFESLGSYWGINHYKENVLIITNRTLDEQTESSTISIIKLLAQQWFLSYIMVDSWTWAWVNDGLTMYLSYNITNEIYPEWIINERLAIETRKAMQDDSKCCCKAINKEANTPSEIKAKFNIINVYKGAALVTMMERIIPPHAFSIGLKKLIEAKNWSTYTSKDLYEEIEKLLKVSHFEETSNLPSKFTEVISAWENQIGYPLVTVTRNYDPYELEKVIIMQEHYHFDKSARKAVWPIPINYVTMQYPNYKNTRPTSWLDKPLGQLTIISLRKTDWLILNNQATYYYRINYDDKNWLLITEALKENHTVIHHLNRIQLIDDAFSLAEFGLLNYSIVLNLCKYIKNERDYGPLKSLRDAFTAINKKITGHKCCEKLQKFIQDSVEYIYDQFLIISNNEIFKETPTFHRTRRTIQFLFSWLCELGSRKCTNRSWRSDDALYLLLSSVFEKYSLSISMKNSNEREWNELFNKYKSDNNSSSTFRMTTALGSNSNLQESFLLFVIKWQKNNLDTAVKEIIHTGTIGVNLVLKFISNIFTTLLLVCSDDTIVDLLNDIGSSVTTHKQLEILIQFLRKYKKYNYLIDPSIARAKQNLKWRKNYLHSIDKYLESSGTILFNNVHAIVLIPQFIKLLLY